MPGHREWNQLILLFYRIRITLASGRSCGVTFYQFHVIYLLHFPMATIIDCGDIHI